MKRTLSRFNAFLAYSCWIVPLYFYIWIPLLLRKSAMPTIPVLLSTVLAFAWVWIAKWEKYQEMHYSKGRFTVDLFSMMLGLALIYSTELGAFGGIDTSHDALYLLLYLTNLPSVMRVKRSLTQ